MPQLANQEGENKTKTKPARLWCYGKSPKKNLVASKYYKFITLSQGSLDSNLTFPGLN